MADFWIIKYKTRILNDDGVPLGNANYDDIVEQHIAVDVDSVVTIEKSDAVKGEHIISVDNGYTYHGKILKKVTEDEVIAEMDKLPTNTDEYLKR